MKKVIVLLLGITILFNGSVISANTSDNSLENNSLIDEELEEELREQEEGTTEESEDNEEEVKEESEEESGGRTVEQDTQNNDNVKIQSENENAEVVENSDGSVTIKKSELNIPSAIVLGVAVLALIGVLVFWKPKK